MSQLLERIQLKYKIQEYIANQLKEDKEVEQMTITELVDPFKK